VWRDGLDDVAGDVADDVDDDMADDVADDAQLTWLMPKIRASQDIANALWALATLSPTLRRPLSPAALADLSGLWAETAVSLFNELDERGNPLMEPQHLSNILWAYAQLRVSRPAGLCLKGEAEFFSEGFSYLFAIVLRIFGCEFMKYCGVLWELFTFQ
jgi:hypothetical protein